MSPDIKRAISFPFEEDRKGISKILVGSFFLLFPIVNFVSLGYILEWTRRVARGEAKELPEWKRFGSLFVEGFKVFILMFFYLILPFLFSVFGFSPMLIGVIRGIIYGEWEIALTAIMGTAFLTVAISLLTFFLILTAYFIFPMALLRFAESGELLYSISLKEIFKDIREQIYSFSISHLSIMGLLIVFSAIYFFFLLFLLILPLGRILIFLLSFIFWGIALFYLLIVGAGLFGECYVELLMERAVGKII